LEDTKQNNITVLDTIQISKLKTQYITMSLTGQDLQSTLTILGNHISSNDTIINALQLLTATHTTEIVSNDTDIAALQLITESHTTEIISNDTDIAALQLLTESH
jgi:hypothetical protein